MNDKIKIKNKLYHHFQSEVERLGQTELSNVTGIAQSSISRALNNPDKTSISWFLKILYKLKDAQSHVCLQAVRKKK